MIPCAVPAGSSKAYSRHVTSGGRPVELRRILRYVGSVTAVWAQSGFPPPADRTAKPCSFNRGARFRVLPGKSPLRDITRGANPLWNVDSARDTRRHRNARARGPSNFDEIRKQSRLGRALLAWPTFMVVVAQKRGSMRFARGLRAPLLSDSQSTYACRQVFAVR